MHEAGRNPVRSVASQY